MKRYLLNRADVMTKRNCLDLTDAQFQALAGAVATDEMERATREYELDGDRIRAAVLERAWEKVSRNFYGDAPEPLHQLLLTTEEVTLLAQALAVAAMDDLNGDLDGFTPSKASRIVWAHVHGPDSSPFRRALGPLATALAELVTNQGEEQ